MATYILRKSDRKGKRFVIEMPDKGHRHHFGSDVGRTYIDGRTDEERDAWIARHRADKNWDNPHSGVYYSRYLLWTERSLKDAIKALERKDKVRIKLG
jgi:hypothetical protein